MFTKLCSACIMSENAGNILGALLLKLIEKFFINIIINTVKDETVLLRGRLQIVAIR